MKLTDTVSFYVSDTTTFPSTTTTGDNFFLGNYYLPKWDWFQDWIFPVNNLPKYTIVYDYKQQNSCFPPINVVLDKANRFMEIKVAIAGFKKEDIEVKAGANYLDVSAKMTKDEPYKREDVYWIKENLKAEEFNRRFEFPDDLFDFRNPKVDYTDGMLTIWIKRNPEKEMLEKKIAIK